MSSKKIYLIRHGQTDYNLQGIIQGSGVDTSLNDTGRAQSEAFFEKYQDISFDKIYTSKLQRSIQSVQGFINKDIPWESYEGLNEISWGNKDGEKVTVEGNHYYEEILKRWSAGECDIPIEGGESPQNVWDRQKPVWELIKTRTDEKNILICMHGRAIRIFLCLLQSMNLKYMDTFPHHNLGLYLLELKNDQIEILLKNDTSHLKHIIS